MKRIVKSKEIDTKLRIKELPSVMSFKEALSYFITRRAVAKMVVEGKLLKGGRGIYLNPKAKGHSNGMLDFILCQKKFGKVSFITGLSALFHFGLIFQPPAQVWVTVPQEMRTTDNKYRLLRVKSISPFGIDDYNDFRMATIERAIVEAFKYATKIGIRTAISALILAIKDGKTTLKKVMEMADKLEHGQSIKRYWELIVGALEAEGLE